MNTSTLIVIVIVAVGIYFYSKSKNGPIRMANDTADEICERANANMTRVLSYKVNPGNEWLCFQDEKDMMKTMSQDIMRLRERFKHDPMKQLEIARDWMDYSSAVWMMQIDKIGAGEAPINYEEAEKRRVRTEEIGKRVAEVLGKDSASKPVHERLKKETEVIRKHFAEKQQTSNKEK